MVGVSDTDFWLLPAGLEQQADVIDEWSAQFALLNQALVPVVLSGEPGADIFNYAIGKASAMHTGMLRWVAHMQNVFAGVSAELREVAAEGRRLDYERAAHIDKYSPTEYNGYDPNPGGRLAPDAGTPPPSYDRYDEPDAPVFPPLTPHMGFYLDAGPGAFDDANRFTSGLFPDDLMSPSGWIRAMMERIDALSFRQRILSGFGGDWSELRSYAYTLEGLSRFLTDAHSSLVPTVGAIGVYWQGYSANSAQAYFEVMLAGILEAAEESLDASVAIESFCDAVVSAADIVGGQVEGLYDSLILAAAAEAFGKRSGPGILVSGGIVMVALARAAGCWYEIRSAVQDMETIFETLKAVEGLLSDLSDFTSKLKVPEMTET